MVLALGVAAWEKAGAMPVASVANASAAAIMIFSFIVLSCRDRCGGRFRAHIRNPILKHR